MNLGYDPNDLIRTADCVLVLECDVPWLPTQTQPPAGCRVVHCGFDPLCSHIPIRGFRCDLAITGSVTGALQGIAEQLEASTDPAAVASRRAVILERRTALNEAWRRARHAAEARAPLHPAWVSHCLGEAKDSDAIVVNEYSLRLEHCGFAHADTLFGSSSASGLGWGAGAALGAKLGAPQRSVIAVLGDGAYLFSNPAAVHHAAALHELPVLFVIFNNGMWNAVARFTAAMYPHGFAVASNAPPFTRLDKLPSFEQICAAAGGHGERVEDPAALPEALARALRVVTHERRQALLNVICSAD